VEGISINNLTAQTFIQAMQPIRASSLLGTDENAPGACCAALSQSLAVL